MYFKEEEEEGEEEFEKLCFVLERLSQGCAFPCVAIPPALLHVSVWKLGNDGDVDALRISSDFMCQLGLQPSGTLRRL